MENNSPKIIERLIKKTQLNCGQNAVHARPTCAGVLPGRQTVRVERLEIQRRALDFKSFWFRIVFVKIE